MSVLSHSVLSLCQQLISHRPVTGDAFRLKSPHLIGRSLLETDAAFDSVSTDVGICCRRRRGRMRA